MNRLSIFFLLCSLFSLYHAAPLPRITIKGQRMFDDKGSQFFCRGIAYAPAANSLTDSPLTDLAALERDIPILKQLNVNCIRVYQFFVHSELNAGMKALEEAGIYLLVDLFDPTDNINRELPVWTTDLFQVNKAKVDKLLNFTNVLGIIVGNEVTNEVGNTDASAYVKAAIRDVKSYIATKGVKLPVGYAGADDANIRDNLQDFFACGSKNESADFFGINIYRWCGNDLTFTSSSYDQFTLDYSDYPIPTILTEFGCIVQAGQRFTREFTEIPTLFGPQMNGVFSGGIAYEYHTAGGELRPEGSYGVVSYSTDESVATLEPEGNFLAEKYLGVIGTKGAQTRDQYTPTNVAPTCPPASSTWEVNPAQLPPTPDISRCTCLNHQFKCRTKIQFPDQITSEYGDKIGRVIGSLCGANPEYCTSIAHDTVNANYGTWSMCGTLVQASLLMNYVYQTTGNCDFSEGADFQEVVEPTVYAQCSANYPGDSADLKDAGIVPPPVDPVDPTDNGGAVTPTTPAPTITTSATQRSFTRTSNLSGTATRTGTQTTPVDGNSLGGSVTRENTGTNPTNSASGISSSLSYCFAIMAVIFALLF